MEMLKKIMKKTILTAFMFLVIILVITWILSKLAVREPEPVVVPSQPIIEKTYTEPVVKLPFIKDKQPISQERLPIPSKDVEKSIAITLPEQNRLLELIIDKKQNVYVPLDTSSDVKVEVTKWQPKLFAVKPRFGYSLAYLGDRDFYHCFSFSPVRIHRFYLGADIGIKEGPGAHSFIIGPHIKYRLFAFNFDKLSNQLEVLIGLGKDFIRGKAYISVGILW